MTMATCIHPAAASPGLLTEMMDVAEDVLSAPTDNGSRRLTVWSNENETALETRLEARGYRKDDGTEFQRRRPVDLPIPEARPGPG